MRVEISNNVIRNEQPAIETITYCDVATVTISSDGIRLINDRNHQFTGFDKDDNITVVIKE